MKNKENKHPYLAAYEIERVKKETTEEILERLNNKQQRIESLISETDHFGAVTIQVLKNGIELQRIELNEEDTANGFNFAELKSIAIDFERMYQDYESLTETIITLKSEWDERE